MYYNLSKLIYPINKSVYKCQVVYLFLCDLSRSQCNIHFIYSFHNVSKNFQNPSALLWIVQSIKVARLGDHGCSFPKEIPAAAISNISNIYPPVISLLKSPAYLCDKIFWRVIMGAVSPRRFLLLWYRTYQTYILLLYPCSNPLLIFVIKFVWGWSWVQFPQGDSCCCDIEHIKHISSCYILAQIPCLSLW